METTVYHDNNNLEQLAGRGLWLLRLYGRLFRLMLVASLLVVLAVCVTLVGSLENPTPVPESCEVAMMRQRFERGDTTTIPPVCTFRRR